MQLGVGDALAQVKVKSRDVTSCSMFGPDLLVEGVRSHFEKNKKRWKPEVEAALSSVAVSQLSPTSSSILESHDDKDLTPTSGCLTVPAASAMQPKYIFISPAVMSAFNQANCPDCGVLSLTGAVA